MDNQPLISVIIPAYNVEKYIQRCVDSAINQTFKPLEILVIDDGSTDATLKKIELYQEKIKYYYKSNGGSSSARNYGIEKASGDWIAFLDSDDEWVNTHLENFVKKLSRKDDLMWYGAPIRYIDEKSKKVIFEFKSKNKSKDYIGGVYFKDYMSAFPPKAFFSSPTMIIKKSVFDKTGLFDISIKTGVDIDMWFRIGLLYPEIGYSTEIAANVYKRSGSLSDLKKWDPDKTLETFRYREELAAGLGEEYTERIEPRIMLWVKRLIKSAISKNDIKTLKKIKKIYYKRLNFSYQVVLLIVTKVPVSTYLINKIM